jgi:YHS domain-containing protein
MRVLFLSATLAALAACSTDRRLLAPDHEADKLVSPEPRNTAKTRMVDPVCGAPLERSEVTWRSMYEGNEYVFESEDCKKAFDENPELFSATVR